MALGKPPLTKQIVFEESKKYVELQSATPEPSLFGVTDGKAVGTFIEHKFLNHLLKNYSFAQGSSANGLDIPELEIDIKVTSITQPQSSCPFTSARQKVYGLGYDLIVFVYQKSDDGKSKTSTLDMKHTIYVEKNRTADYQMTRGILQILENKGNRDDLTAFFRDRNLPIDDMEAEKLADAILVKPPYQGYLTISNALQWRLQYQRVIDIAGDIEGVFRLK